MMYEIIAGWGLLLAYLYRHEIANGIGKRL